MSFVFLLKPTDCPRLLLRSSWQLESPTDTPPPFPSDYSWLWNGRAHLSCGSGVAQACPDLPLESHREPLFQAQTAGAQGQWL